MFCLFLTEATMENEPSADSAVVNIATFGGGGVNIATFRGGGDEPQKSSAPSLGTELVTCGNKCLLRKQRAPSGTWGLGPQSSRVWVPLLQLFSLRSQRETMGGLRRFS